MRELTPRETVSQGIESLYYNFPLFANIAANWEVAERTDLPTMATDGRHLFYNPDFVHSLTIAEVAWVVLHECGHCFLGHHLRLRDADRTAANIAFDLALNSLIRGVAPSDKLRKMMLAPGHGEYAKLPADQDAEFYHRSLNQPQPPAEPQPKPNQPDDQQEQEQDDQQEQDGDGDAGEAEPEGGDTGEPGELEGDGGAGEPGDTPGESGGETDDQTPDKSAAQQSANGGTSDSEPAGAQSDTPAGQAAPKENSGCQETGHYQSMGDVLPQQCETPAEAAAAEGEWQTVVAETMALGEMCGNLPGWLRSLGEKLLGKSEVDWRTILRRFLTKVVPQGNTYQRPSRRSGWRKDIILPAHRSKGGGDGLIIADVSGSIYSAINEAVFPEIEKILRTIPKASVTLMQIDTQIRSEERYDQYRKLKLDIKGGGGTDLDPAFRKAAAERGKYKWIICLTDFYWGFQSAPNPGVPVLWIAVGRPDFKDKLPFGELVITRK